MRSVKRLLAGLLCLAMLFANGGFVLADQPAVLADVAGHWALPEITCLWARGVIDGDAFFYPDADLKRGAFVRMLVRAAGYGDEVHLAARGKSRFTDLPDGHWALGDAEVAAEIGLVKGYPDGTFGPDRNITRAEIVTMLVRAYRWEEQALARQQATLPFSDAETVPEWVRGYVAVASERGILKGFEDGSFRAHDWTTRAQGAAMVARMMAAAGSLYHIEGTLVAAGSGRVQLLSGADVITVPLADGCAILRNGEQVTLGDLQPIDEVQGVLNRQGQMVLVAAHFAAVLGELQRVDGQSLTVRVGDVEQELLWAPGAEVFLNARPVQLGSLQAGDRAYLVLRQADGRVRIADCARLSLEGILTGHMGERGFLLQESSRRLSLTLADDAVVYLDGAPASLRDISVGVPVAVAVDGELVVYLEANSGNAAVVSLSAASEEQAGLAAAEQMGIDAIRAATVQAPDEDVQMLLALPEQDIIPQVINWGGSVTELGEGYAVARVPGRYAVGLARQATAASLLPATATVAANGLTAVHPQAKLSAEVNGAAIGLPDFRTRTGGQGEGTVIAVIDTGADPSHLDLVGFGGPGGKIIDWRDFTYEGYVETAVATLGRRGIISTPRGELKIGSITSRSGRYHYGFLREEQVDRVGPLGQDLDRNGRSGDVFPVLVVDMAVAGVYDTVFVDTDRDNDFTDERGLFQYQKRPAYAHFGRDRWDTAEVEQVAFVAAEIDPAGNFVRLGFDGNGHGTHVASIAAGKGSGGPGIVGVAPGAQLMVLKALGSSGNGRWEDIMSAMVYAAQQGADIISISVGGELASAGSGSRDAVASLLSDLVRRYGVLVVMVPGNNGPGLGSAGAPGSADSVLAVGAAITQEAWRTFFGERVWNDSLWYYSACGPRPDGSLCPNLVAPGCAVAAVPKWQVASGHDFFEGTSMAVPHVAGAAAVLLAEARQRGLNVTPAAVKRALEMTATPLPGYAPVEQGYGMVNVAAAWDSLSRNATAARIRGRRGGEAWGGGIYLRDTLPGSVSYRLQGEPGQHRFVNLISSVPWLSADRQSMSLPAGTEREVLLRYQIPAQPGLYSGLLWADVPATGQRDLGILTTAVQPLLLAKENDWQLALSGRVGPAQRQRHYIKVPEGLQALQVKLTLPPGSGGPAGEARLHIFRPGGSEYLLGDFIGYDQIPSGGQRAGSASYVIKHPQAGVWELIVSGAPFMARYGFSSTPYELQLTGVGVMPGRETVALSVANGGGYLEQALTFTNAALNGAGLAVSCAGLAAANGVSPAETMTLRPQEATTHFLPPIDERVTYLQVAVSGVSRPDVDLDLYLYRYDRELGEWVECAAAARMGVQDEVIDLPSPQPGQYLAYIEAYGFPGDPVTFQYRQLVSYDCGHLTVQGQPAAGEGAQWQAVLGLKVPEERGRYFGQVLIKDVAGSLVNVVPVVLDVGMPGLKLHYSWGQPGTGGQVPLRLDFRDATSLVPVAADVFVNGRLYEGRDGHVELALASGAAAVGPVVQVANGEYAGFEAVLEPPAEERGFAVAVACQAGGDAPHRRLQNHWRKG